ncbi:GDNF family receptor alpha-like Precursor [Channa argus]|uniref:GDNF family receptor alpha-like n=1 Tax=Channa argus TaxID=215402 RepID=A0A6G1R082_CHAAH|nr:GDNF family receptor alpha-like Precursor [Channa argus]
MHLIHLETAVILGIVFAQISSNSISLEPSDCLAAAYTCMSDLCQNEEDFSSGICDDEGCQIKGLEGCNMTIQSVLDQFPSLRGCVCAWQEELCDSIQALATECHRKPATQQKRSTVVDWQSSSLIAYVYDGSRSCLDQITVCVSDTVCNKYLAPVVQACLGHQCNRDHCQQETQRLYGSMPHSVAEMLVMCECEASDQSCLQMRTALHSGTCGDETWVCQDTVKLCVKDSNCRDLLKTFQEKCWRSEEGQCSESDLQNVDCFPLMDPGLILCADSQCKMAFLATLGTALHYPCSCKGLHSRDLLTCNMIHNILHNRSCFMTSQKSSNGPSKPPEISKSDKGQTLPIVSDYFMYAFATVLLVGIVLIMPIVVVSKIW